MNYIQKKAMVLILIFVVLVFSFGCAKNTIEVETENPEVTESEELKEDVVLNVGTLNGPTSIGMIQLIDKEPSFGENVEIIYNIMPSPDVLLAKLLTGEIDIATVPTNAAAKVYNKGVDYKLVATTIWGVMYVVGSDEEIKTIGDLKGKLLHSVGKGVTPDVITRYLLDKEGIDSENDLEINYGYPPIELAQAMVAGKANLAILPEPFTTMVTMQNSEMKVLIDLQKEYNTSVGTESNSLAQTCIVVKGDILESNPELVSSFLKSYKESIDWVNENPVEASVLVEKHKIIGKAKMAELAIPRLNMDYKTTEESKESVIGYLKVLNDFAPETIGGQLPDEDFYYINK